MSLQKKKTLLTIITDIQTQITELKKVVTNITNDISDNETKYTDITNECNKVVIDNSKGEDIAEAVNKIITKLFNELLKLYTNLKKDFNTSYNLLYTELIKSYAKLNDPELQKRRDYSTFVSNKSYEELKNKYDTLLTDYDKLKKNVSDKILFYSDKNNKEIIFNNYCKTNLINKSVTIITFLQFIKPNIDANCVIDLINFTQPDKKYFHLKCVDNKYNEYKKLEELYFRNTIPKTTSFKNNYDNSLNNFETEYKKLELSKDELENFILTLQSKILIMPFLHGDGTTLFKDIHNAIMKELNSFYDLNIKKIKDVTKILKKEYDSMVANSIKFKFENDTTLVDINYEILYYDNILKSIEKNTDPNMKKLNELKTQFSDIQLEIEKDFFETLIDRHVQIKGNKLKNTYKIVSIDKDKTDEKYFKLNFGTTDAINYFKLSELIFVTEPVISNSEDSNSEDSNSKDLATPPPTPSASPATSRRGSNASTPPPTPPPPPATSRTGSNASTPPPTPPPPPATSRRGSNASTREAATPPPASPATSRRGSNASIRKTAAIEIPPSSQHFNTTDILIAIYSDNNNPKQYLIGDLLFYVSDIDANTISVMHLKTNKVFNIPKSNITLLVKYKSKINIKGDKCKLGANTSDVLYFLYLDTKNNAYCKNKSTGKIGYINFKNLIPDIPDTVESKQSNTNNTYKVLKRKTLKNQLASANQPTTKLFNYDNEIFNNSLVSNNSNLNSISSKKLKKLRKASKRLNTIFGRHNNNNNNSNNNINFKVKKKYSSDNDNSGNSGNRKKNVKSSKMNTMKTLNYNIKPNTKFNPKPNQVFSNPLFDDFFKN